MSINDHVSGTRLTLDVWHPDSWVIEATEQTGGGVLADTFYDSSRMDSDSAEDITAGVFTGFGNDETEVEHLIAAIRTDDRTGDLLELHQRFGRQNNTPGNAAQEFLLEYNYEEMVCPKLLEQGFIPTAPVRVENGRETWQVCFIEGRAEMETALDNVREQAAANVRVSAITTYTYGGGDSERDQRRDSLTPAQRKVFDRACEMGYYEWPRETTSRELADGLDISKTTLLEHLRKAELKLLDP